MPQIHKPKRPTLSAFNNNRLFGSVGLIFCIMQIEELLALLTVAAAALQIILFFKLWAMTNDVKAIRESNVIANKENFNFEIRKLIASGNKEKAVELILNRFYKRIAELNYSGLNPSVSQYEQIKSNIDNDFANHKKKLEAQLSQIGVEMPERIKQMKSGNEFYELFKAE